MVRDPNHKNCSLLSKSIHNLKLFKIFQNQLPRSIRRKDVSVLSFDLDKGLFFPDLLLRSFESPDPLRAFKVLKCVFFGQFSPFLSLFHAWLLLPFKLFQNLKFTLPYFFWISWCNCSTVSTVCCIKKDIRNFFILFGRGGGCCGGIYLKKCIILSL